MASKTESDEEFILMDLAAAAPRLWLGLACTGGLGVLMGWILINASPGPLYQLMFAAIGLGAIWVAVKLWQAGSEEIILTNKVLKTKSGRVLTHVDNVRSVERGAFSFKPPNGFLVHLKEPSGQGWVPGLWWQRGRRIGVGGVVPAGRSRAMAEALTALTLDLHPEVPAP